MEEIKKEGFWADAEVIVTYTRAQAIEDGVLVDLMQPELEPTVREAGFIFPVAMTAEAFNDYVALTPAAVKHGCNLTGRLWDILYMLKLAIKKHKSGPNLIFEFMAVTDNPRRPKKVQLKANIGPGDMGEPVMTIMHPWQD
jgi:hypothetical protein